MSASPRSVALLACTALLSTARSTAAQTAYPEASLSADTVEMGEVFELTVSTYVPRGSVVYFPDSVAAASFLESFAPVRWETEEVFDQGATLTLTYPLIAYRAGTVPVPGIDVFTGPAAPGIEGDSLPGGSVIGDWSSVPRGRAALPFTRRVPRRGVFVEPVFTVEDLERGLEPRPPGDVVGSSWHWPSVALVLLFTSVLGGAVVSTTRDWLASRSPLGQPSRTRALSVEEARLLALDELDELLALGLHTEGRIQEFYTRSSGILRAYVERLDSEWGPSLTTSELMRGLEAGSSGEEGALVHEMRSAEVVKFGRLRPDAPAAERHLATLREWVDGPRGTAS